LRTSFMAKWIKAINMPIDGNYFLIV